MIKIKDEIDLKELEKHLIKLNIMDGDDTIHSNVYCCVQTCDMEDIENNCIQTYDVQFYINKVNEIRFCNYPEQRDTHFILNKIYDLIKADLIEKV